MSNQLGLEDLTALLLEEHRSNYEGSIPPKALHKTLYFAKQQLDREGVETDLPWFWYMYGAMVKTANSGVGTTQTPKGRRVTCNLEAGDIEAEEADLHLARRAVSNSLEQYYREGLEPLTNVMYREAPYHFQRLYRRLDNQLATETDSTQATLFGPNNAESFRETVLDMVEAFPVDEFPEFEDELHIWYRLVSAELDSDDYDPERVVRLTQRFWRLFCLELACRENNGLTRAEIAEELHNVESIETAKEELQADFLERERAKARENARDSDVAVKAAEAFVLPFLANDTAG